MSIVDQLKGALLFRGVDQADCEALIKVMRRQSYPAGAILFQKGDPGDTMYIILGGRIRIFVTDAEARELTIRHYGPGEMFGEFSPIDQKPRSASAAAAEPLDVLILHRDDFLTFLQDRPLVGLAMMRTLVERLRYTTNYLQQVMDAIQQLSQGSFNPLAEEVPAAGADADIQKLIEVFLEMVRSVQAREATLRQEADIQPPQSDA
jgi:CRP-like cAMP-binding protein